MKKLIVAMILICITLSICACDTEKTSSSNSSSSSSYSSSSNVKYEVESAALDEAYSKLKSDYSYQYDISATRYKVGKTDIGNNRFTIYYTFYLYDNYGNYKRSVEYKVTGWYSDSGVAYNIRVS